ncbi:heavy-metal-associated domain-containing protein [Nesterenkonia sp.]|uniref:heavy-metal-associated domain-containing protein n=1 Tax=Nesterenkonia sp. TaxID=704201 RepID=UPI00262BFE96|nr:heavy-metal-associated domain-containing protein [Nesterenkonia sp.]
MTQTLHYTVTGMSCSHCEAAVREEVSVLPGVTEVSVSADDGSLVLTLADGATVSEADVLAAVDEAGYQAQPRS